ncbi:MAG: carbohydrate ABC transporter permease [Clostridia bacterium]|nr:carbohydrate ABC transporter permease [Clostridia bacterium]
MRKHNKVQQAVLIIIFSILCLAIIFPFWLLLSASFSDAGIITTHGYQIWPNPFDLTAYKYVFQHPQQILRAYGITFVFSIATMVLSVLFMAMVAYPLSRDHLRGRSAINFYLYFTMLFGGGLVPTYLLISRTLHLNDTIWVYILPGLISPWYVFMMRTFFKGIPGEIIESATIDGASEYTIFIKMILPLSKPVLATVALFMFLGKWNDWNTALIYITKPELYSLQYLLQKIMEDINILKQNQQMISGMISASDIPSETVRMAMAVVVAGPALVVFPFFQKYFVKGLTVGSVKG